MNFCWVTLHVKNLEESLSFYHGMLGLPINSTHSGNGIEMAMLGEENLPKIELLHSPNTHDQQLSSVISIGISVESLESTIEYLKNRQIPIIRGPLSPAPNVSFIFVHDPDGYEVQLVEMKHN